jgi:hypothetical protein
MFLLLLIGSVENTSNPAGLKELLSLTQKIEQREHEFDFQIVLRSERSVPFKESTAYRKYWTRATGSLRFEHERAENPKSRIATVFNPRYEFTVRREENTGWALKNFALKHPDRDMPHDVLPEIIEHWIHLSPTSSILNSDRLTIADMFAHSDFKLLSLQRAGDITELCFTLPSQRKSDKDLLIDYRVQFDHSKNGAVLTCKIKPTKGFFVQVENEYASAPIRDYWPLSKTTMKTYTSPEAKNLRMTRTITYESVTPTKYTDRDFTLSAFGLPEPPGDETPGWGINGYLILAASIAAVATLLFWWLARRKSA